MYGILACTLAGFIFLSCQHCALSLNGGVFTSFKPVRTALLESISQISELDLIANDRISWWSLRGSSYLAPLQMAVYSKLASSPNIKNVCESTFNSGHSAAVFLTSNPEVKYWGFDQLGLPFSNRSVDALKRMFPNRIEIIVGPQEETMLEFPSRGITCDLFSFSGRLDYDALTKDIDNAIKLMQPGSVLLADEISDTCPGCVKAWEDAVAQGKITQSTCQGPPKQEGQWAKRWCFGVVAEASSNQGRALADVADAQAEKSSGNWQRSFKYGMLVDVQDPKGGQMNVTLSPLLSGLMDALSQLLETDVPKKEGKIWDVLQESLHNVPLKLAKYARLARYSEVSNICEVGLGAGHSAAAFLSANPEARYWGFDRLDLAFSNRAVSTLQRLFPNRVAVSSGDPIENVPKFAQKSKNVICDLYSISGVTDAKSAEVHINNALTIMHPAGILLMDGLSDTNPEVAKAWDAAVAAGQILNAECDEQTSKSGTKHRWCYGNVAQVHLPQKLVEKLDAAEPIDMVLTFCLGAHVLERGGKYFAASLAANSPKAKLIIFADQDCAQTLDFRALKNVVICPTAQMHPILWRFHVWKDYLRLHATRYRFAITADMRDIVFQTNPFSAVARAVNTLAKGSPNVAIVSEEALPGDDKDYPNGPENEKTISGGRWWNGMWLKECFGEEIFKRLVQFSPVNAGFVAGTSSGVLKFIEKQHEIEAKFCPDLDKMGPDQAITIYMAYTFATKEWNTTGLELRVVPNGELALHMVLIANHFPMKMDSNDNLVSPFDGRVYAALHQYDRSKTVEAMVMRKWGRRIAEGEHKSQAPLSRL